jgi:hypothetical protein
MQFAFKCILVACFILSLSSCKNDGSQGATFNVTDTSSVSLANHQNEENQNALVSEEESGAEYQPGNKIEFTYAGYFLSSMLYHSVNWQESSENSNSIQLKLAKNQFSPMQIVQDFEPKHTIVKCASYNEGFGGLADAFYMTYEPKLNKSVPELISELSGLSYTRITEHSQPFAYINPKLIDWCWNNFYRTPNSGSIADVSLNTVYDIVFKKFVRTLVVAHNEMEGNNLENEKNWYRNTVIMEKGYAPELLSKRYVVPEKYNKDELNINYYPYASGFWIRRSIDESAPVLWNYLRILVMDYDYDWACKTFHICDRG